MDALAAIHARRSIRAFGPEPVADAQVEALLRAAMAAPSAGNAQPWEFVVVRRQELRDAVARIHPHARMVPRAPLAILLCAATGREKYPGFWVQDMSAATQNLLLAATALGLGAVWCGIHPDAARVAAFRALFRLPPGVEPFAIVPVGRPAEDKTPQDRYDAARIRRETWEG